MSSQIQDRLAEWGTGTDIDWLAIRDDPEELAGINPEELGLSPLGCANCGERAIGSHPCPACGFEPGGDGE